MSDSTAAMTTRDKLAQLVRFAVVGGFNTALDFTLLFLFVYLAGWNEILSNVVSTGICLVISFLLNKKWTFRASGNPARQFVLFLVVTLFGLWVLQTIVIWGAMAGLAVWAPDIPNALALGAAKLAATVVSLTWNYLMYGRVVFTEQAQSDKS